MKIYIDANELTAKKYRGIPWYLYHILNNIDVEKRQNIVLITFFNVKSPDFDGTYKVESFGMSRILARSRFALFGGFKINKLDADVYWAPSFVVPRFINSKIKVVVTIHDLTPFKKHSQQGNFVNRILHRLYSSEIEYSVSRADKIVTVSETVANEIVNFFDVNRNKINVVSPAYDKELFQHKTSISKQFYEKYKIKDNFVLAGNLKDLRKNFPILVKAFKIVKAKGLLCVFGGLSEQQILLARNEIGERFNYLGYVDEIDLPILYSAANAFIVPSIEEGFDIPALEARACGTKVIASDIPVHREVLENEAEYFGIDDYNKLSNLISESLSVDKMFIPSRIVNKYDWKESSNKMFEILTTRE